MTYFKGLKIGALALSSAFTLGACQAATNAPSVAAPAAQIAERALTLVGTDFGPMGTSIPSFAICPEATTPGFSWNNAPEGTQSYILTMHAPVYTAQEIAAGAEQRPFKYWWILYNIPASASSVAPGETAGGTLGTNIARGEPALGYSPPCPQGGGTDIPVSFTLFAVSDELEFVNPIDVTWEALQTAIEGKLLGSKTLNATFDRVIDNATE
jgi:phosphatidylethanolamine-binding protein (PEBP) family uncharacterized protein